MNDLSYCQKPWKMITITSFMSSYHLNFELWKTQNLFRLRSIKCVNMRLFLRWLGKSQRDFRLRSEKKCSHICFVLCIHDIHYITYLFHNVALQILEHIYMIFLLDLLRYMCRHWHKDRCCMDLLIEKKIFIRIILCDRELFYFKFDLFCLHTKERRSQIWWI